MYRTPDELTKVVIAPDASLRQAVAAIDGNQQGIVLLCDRDEVLLGTISDGDVRRAVLNGIDLDAPAVDLLARKDGTPYPEPVTAPAEATRQQLLKLMDERVIRQVPLVDETDRVVDLALMRDLMPQGELPVKAVIMAGGQGTRLRPLTEDLPKPLLPVGERPIMELMVERLRQCGVGRVAVTSHYKQEKITEHFGDGSAFGVDLEYVREEQPLGTAGALALLPTPTEDLLVVNGDILTDVDFGAMHDYHRDNQAAMTVALWRYDMDVPYGVVECSGSDVVSIQEKPKHRFFINAGMYLIAPEAIGHIPCNQRFDMTDLMDELLRSGKKVVGFPVREYWLDIGELDSYRQAQEDVKNGRLHR